MKPLIGPPFDQWRVQSAAVLERYGSYGDSTCGVFTVRTKDGYKLHVIASTGGGWDHVSVSRPSRCPTWEEMSFVKRAFFQENEWAIEYHLPPDKNVSLHNFCLHLWRPNNGLEIPLPNSLMIA